MLHKYLEIAPTPAVREKRRHYGSQAQYSRIDGSSGSSGDVRYDELGPDEQEFIAERDGFYVASVSETGWPYMQFRGGPVGFLKVLDTRKLGWADFRGNRQYVTIDNVTGNDRISLFLMDYAHRRRLKIFGHMHFVDVSDNPELAARLAVPGYDAKVERAVTIDVEAFDWNCPQHITPRFTEAEFAEALAPIKDQIASLEAENRRLKPALAS
jgi:hypothetical protein